MNESKSSITIKETGEINDKATGKKIKQSFDYKIYVDSVGKEATKELKEIRELFDSKVSRGNDFTPINPTTKVV
jgi:hypothetical protein